MANRQLHIAWLGAGPGRRESGGVPGVATELLAGLAARGHRIDCFLPASGRPLPARLLGNANLTFVWGTSSWRWDRWYARAGLAPLTNLISRALAAMRLRRAVAHRHRLDPYDVVYQFSSIETLSMPSRLRREVALVMHPEVHSAGELRFMLSERRLALRSDSRRRFIAGVALMALRSPLQRLWIRRASLVICISRAFRDQLVADYGLEPSRALVVPNPVRLERFDPSERAPSRPPTVLVLGRVAVRKGIQDVVELAGVLAQRQAAVRLRVVGGPGQWSDYRELLQELPPDLAEYAGAVPAPEVPAELARCEVLLVPSRYEPFGLNVAEALAAGVPVVATSQVGAIEDVAPAVASRVAPGDVGAMAGAIELMLARVRTEGAVVAHEARAEAERLFAPATVCARISAALEQLAEKAAR